MSPGFSGHYQDLELLNEKSLDYLNMFSMSMVCQVFDLLELGNLDTVSR